MQLTAYCLIKKITLNITHIWKTGAEFPQRKKCKALHRTLLKVDYFTWEM